MLGPSQLGKNLRIKGDEMDYHICKVCAIPDRLFYFLSFSMS